MSTKIAIFAWQEVGATFLDWSIHWLSGANKSYNEYKGWVTLPSNPLIISEDGKFNAHRYEKNFPRGNSELQNTILKCNSIDAKLLSCFVHLLPPEIAANTTPFIGTVETQGYDLADCITTCKNNDWHIILLSIDDPIYDQKVRFIGPKINSIKEAYANEDEMIDEYFNLFFKESYNHWVNDLKLTAIWDRREFLALNIQINFNPTYAEYIDRSIDHLYINAKDLFFNGPAIIQELFNKFNLSIDQDRLTSWLPIYYTWQSKQAEILKFSWNLDHICNCIVNNYYYDLSSYNLNLKQEAIIQHVMIYKYNLNFKTWGLEKFPKNTQDLHKILEPNIHPTNQNLRIP